MKRGLNCCFNVVEISFFSLQVPLSLKMSAVRQINDLNNCFYLTPTFVLLCFASLQTLCRLVFANRGYRFAQPGY